MRHLTPVEDLPPLRFFGWRVSEKAKVHLEVECSAEMRERAAALRWGYLLRESGHLICGMGMPRYRHPEHDTWIWQVHDFADLPLCKICADRSEELRALTR